MRSRDIRYCRMLGVVATTGGLIACDSSDLHLNGRQTRPQATPDGNRVVVSGQADGGASYDLFLVDLRDRTYTQLVATADANEEWPCVSHDGARTAFVSEPRHSEISSILLMDSVTGRTTQITHDPAPTRAPIFSVDDTYIYFVRPTQRREHSLGGITWDQWDLWRVSLRDLQQEQITAQNYYTMSAPSMSPDGSLVVFAGSAFSTELVTSLFVIDLRRGGVPEVLIRNGDGINIDWSPVFSPDGKVVVFCSNRESRKSPFDYELWEMVLETKELRQLTHLRSYLDAPTFVFGGRGIVFVRDDDRSGHYTLSYLDLLSDEVTKLSPLARER